MRTVLIVSRLCGASPERMFARLAPSENSSPRPSECRRSSSIASFGWFVTIGAPRSFSHQRNAGMSSLSPCSNPAWQAPVCEDQSVSQPARLWVPSRSQLDGVGALARAAPYDVAVVDRVVVDGEKGRREDVGDRDDERDDDRRPESVDD